MNKVGVMTAATDFSRRGAERFEMALPASLSVDDPESPKKLIELLTRDICSGGAFLQTGSPLPSGTEVDMSLSIPLDTIPGMNGKRSRIRAMGRVVRAQDQGMAVRFDLAYQLMPVMPNVVAYVAGQSRLQSELLAHFLEHELGIRTGFGSIDQLAPDFLPEPNTTYITIVDYPNIRSLMPLTELESRVDFKGAQTLLALFNADPSTELGIKALRHGMRGVFFNDSGMENFAQGISALATGELWFPKDILAEHERLAAREAEAEAPGQEQGPLTRKEKEILAVVAHGATNKEIADKLFISVHTVKTHLYRIFKKIGASNRLQATLWATRNLET